MINEKKAIKYLIFLVIFFASATINEDYLNALENERILKPSIKIVMEYSICYICIVFKN
jgi:hypothetical protein